MSLILEQNKDIFKTKFTGWGMFIVVMLGFALLALGERILFDASRIILNTDSVNYFNDLGFILVHSAVIVGFIILALIVNLIFKDKKEKYAVALVPYYFVAILLVFQLLIQIAIYFSYHHTRTQFYVVISGFVVILTYGTYFIQSNFISQKNGNK